jgi:hypothetical protein
VKKNSDCNFHEIIDNEIYGIIEVDPENLVTNKPASTTSIDSNENDNSKTGSDSFAEAIVKFIDGCQKIMEHSESTRYQNQQILTTSQRWNRSGFFMAGTGTGRKTSDRTGPAGL